MSAYFFEVEFVEHRHELVAGPISPVDYPEPSVQAQVSLGNTVVFTMPWDQWWSTKKHDKDRVIEVFAERLAEAIEAVDDG